MAETFNEHIKLHNNQSLLEIQQQKREETSKCKICGKIVAFPDNFTKHMKIHAHNAEENQNGVKLGGYSVICRFCDEIFYTRSKFMKHINALHKKKYTCDICKQYCGNSRSFMLHKRIHDDRKVRDEPPAVQSYKCNYCDKLFAYSENLKYHLRANHNVNANCKSKFTCDVCKKVLSSKSRHNHKQIHLNFPNKCTYCRKVLAKPGFLKRHLDKHLEAV